MDVNSRLKLVAAYAFLAALTWSVFGQTITHDFINYDDPNYVYENPHVRAGLTTQSVAWAFTHTHGQNWHPLTSISHMLDCQFYGLNPGGHHFSNVFLHSIAVVLLFAALRELTRTYWQSLFVAAVFAVHPLRVESVAWIAERKDVLSGAFFMLTLWTYARYAQNPSGRRYLSMSILFALGLLSKPMLVTVPFVLLLLDYWPLRRFSESPSIKSNGSFFRWLNRQSTARRLIIEKIPLFALSAVSCAVTLLVQHELIGSTEALPLVSRVNNAAMTYALYVRDMFWPVRLAPFYPHPESQLQVWQIALAAVALCALTMGFFVWRKERPYLLTGWLWYLGMLVPVIGLIQVGWQARADRYTYLPQIGLYIAVTWGIVDLSALWRQSRKLIGPLAVGSIAVLACSAWVQTSYWKDNEKLWTHTLAVTERNDVALNNLGIVFLARGLPDQALAKFQEAALLRPENAPAQGNLGKAFLQKGKIDEAMVHYHRLLELEPDNLEARNILGTSLFQQGKVREAIAEWQKILAIESDNGNALSNLAWVLATYPDASIRNGAQAVDFARRAASLSHQRSPIILRTLAAAYAEDKRFDEAIATAQEAKMRAQSEAQQALAHELEMQIDLYRRNIPLRDTSPSRQ
ncbi:MAG: protein O-mannosyl-transferase [Verrucomicrobiota bacterium]